MKKFIKRLMFVLMAVVACIIIFLLPSVFTGTTYHVVVSVGEDITNLYKTIFTNTSSNHETSPVVQQEVIEKSNVIDPKQDSIYVVKEVKNIGADICVIRGNFEASNHKFDKLIRSDYFQSEVQMVYGDYLIAIDLKDKCDLLTDWWPNAKKHMAQYKLYEEYSSKLMYIEQSEARMLKYKKEYEEYQALYSNCYYRMSQLIRGRIKVIDMSKNTEVAEINIPSRPQKYSLKEDLIYNYGFVSDNSDGKEKERIEQRREQRFSKQNPVSSACMINCFLGSELHVNFEVNTKRLPAMVFNAIIKSIKPNN